MLQFIHALKLLGCHANIVVGVRIPFRFGARQQAEHGACLGNGPRRIRKAAEGRRTSVWRLNIFGRAALRGSAVQLPGLLRVPACHPVAILQGGNRDVQIANAFGAEIGFELVALMMVVQRFDALLKAYGDEETDDDGGDVSEKLAPGSGSVVRRMDVDHRGQWILWEARFR